MDGHLKPSPLAALTLGGAGYIISDEFLAEVMSIGREQERLQDMTRCDRVDILPHESWGIGGRF